MPDKKSRGISNLANRIPDVPDAPTVSASNVGTSRAYNNGAATITISSPTGGLPSSYSITTTPTTTTTTTTTSPVTLTGLSSATSYTVTVTPSNVSATGTATTSSAFTATTVPQAPTIGTASRTNDTTVSLTFTAGATGGSSITSYTATASPTVGDIATSGTSSPLSITGTFSSGTSYTLTLTATNENGTSLASTASNSVTPKSIPLTLVGSVNPSASISNVYMPLKSANNTFVVWGVATTTSGADNYFCASSTNGTDWTLKGTNLGPTQRPDTDSGKLIYTASGYYIIPSTNAGKIIYSTDLITWTEKTVGGIAVFSDIETDGTSIACLVRAATSTVYYINSTNPTGSWTAGSANFGTNVSNLNYWGTNWYTTSNANSHVYRTSSLTTAVTQVRTGSTSAYTGPVWANSKSSPTLFVAGSYPSILYSTNGSTWSVATGQSSNYSIAYDSTTSRFILEADDTHIKYSTNGSSWTTVESKGSYTNGVQSIGGVTLIISQTGLINSTDGGGTWTRQNVFAGNYNPYYLAPNVAYGNGVWIANTSSANSPGEVTSYKQTLSYSTDLSSWTNVNLYGLSFDTGNQLHSISFANGKFWTGTVAGLAMAYSSNGSTWTKSTTFAPAASLYVTVMTGDGSNSLLAVDHASSTNSYSYSTNNGTSWTNSTFPSGYLGQGSAYGNGKFVVITIGANGTDNRIGYSTNLTSWTWTSIGVVDYPYSIIYSSSLGKFFVFIGGADYYTSTDGVSWTRVIGVGATNLGFQNGIVSTPNGLVSRPSPIGHKTTDGLNWTPYTNDGIVGNTSGSGMTGLIDIGMQTSTSQNIATDGTTVLMASYYRNQLTKVGA